jgi:DNA uptake protein ComE-like DNA-binding protein
MRRLADFLEIDFDPSLTTPTFNGYPVGPNSSYEVRSTGVVTDPVERYKELLSTEQQDRVREQCEDLYQEALALVERHAAATAPAKRISLGTATIGQLIAIEGIGRATARQIIEFRDRHGGDVSSIEELAHVSGVGPRTMRALRARLEA